MSTEHQVLVFLNSIEQGVAKLQKIPDNHALVGYRLFQASSGWRVGIVVDDFGDWHHLHELWTPTGDYLDPWDESYATEFAEVRAYQPSSGVACAAFGEAKLRPAPTSLNETTI